MEEKTLTCGVCNKTVKITKTNGNRGRICNSCRQKYRQLKLKKKAVEYKGGKCKICGYNKNIYALEFHHRNPEEKEFQISCKFNLSWENIQYELDKCDMLCANCHRELHAVEYEVYKIEDYEKYINVETIKEKQKKVREKEKREYWDKKAKEIENRKNIVKSCNIDFSKSGWAQKLSTLFNVSSSTAVIKWIKLHMPKFYQNNCFRQKEVSNKDILYIIEQYNGKNKSIKSISLNTGLTPERISYILKEKGFEVKTSIGKIINMIDVKTNKIIKTFTSISEAAVYCEDNFISIRSKNITSKNAKKKISSCVNGHQKTAYGYIWQEAS